MQMTDPLSKLCGVGDGGRQKDVMNIVWQQDDCFLPHNASLCKQISIYMIQWNLNFLCLADPITGSLSAAFSWQHT